MRIKLHECAPVWRLPGGKIRWQVYSFVLLALCTERPGYYRGSMEGAVLGPVLMAEPDDLLLDEIMEKGRIDRSKAGEVKG